jgi:hypothetical protein
MAIEQFPDSSSKKNFILKRETGTGKKMIIFHQFLFLFLFFLCLESRITNHEGRKFRDPDGQYMEK